MTFILATMIYPVVLAFLCVGAGLLADRASGRFLPLAVMPALGLALLIGVSQLMSYLYPIAPATPFVFVAVAALGWWLGAGRLHGMRRRLRADPWPALAMVGVYVAAIGPVLLLGRPSLSLYLTDTTSATHLAGADFLLHHGRDFGALDLNTSRGQYLENYFGSTYPSGGHTMLGASAWLVPVRLTWAYQPFMAFLLATVAGPMWVLLRRVGLQGWWAGLGALTACLPALVYAFDVVGSIKEITALPMIMLTGVLVADHARWLAGRWNAAIPFGLAAAGGLSAIGVAFGVWIAISVAVLAGVVVSDAALGGRRLKPFLVLVGAGAVILVVAALPTVVDLADALRATSGIATTADPGNLSHPLDVNQMFGVWIGPDYRLPATDQATLTVILVGVTAVAMILGLAQMARRRLGSLLAWSLLLGVAWAILTVKGTTWTDGKMLMLTSPIIALAAWSGVAALRRSQRVFEASVLALVLAAGVLGSDILQYHSANAAPTARFDELASINDRFGGQGPTLLPDFDEYPLYELRDMKPSSPGMAFKPASLGTVGTGYGFSVDPDDVPPGALAQFPTLVLRRGPTTSRPSSTYALAWRGRYYEVWKHRAGAPRVVAHVGAGRSQLSATGEVACRDLATLARRATAIGGTFAVALRPATVSVSAVKTNHTADWLIDGRGSIMLLTPGRLTTTMTVPHAGRWNVWVRGQVMRPIDVAVDGRRVKTIGGQTSTTGNYLTPVPVTLTKGPHEITLYRGGGSPGPGDRAPSSLTSITLAPVAAESGVVAAVPPSRWRSLCGRQIDWLEIVKAS